MCGIVGILNNDTTRPVDPSVLRAMCGTIRHRGPDDEGVYIDRNLGIGMRRLSVIDVEGGRQPIANEAGTCRIVFNGEIYNHPDLRARNEARGHTYTTGTDTESILHLYEDEGARCVDALNGMFAFAILDERTRTVTVARDRLGIKPLFYAETPTGLVFGSEIKAILAHPGVSREIDPIGVDDYLAYKFIPAPRTIYRSVRKLPPGHLMTWREGSFTITPYWDLDYAETDRRDEREIAEELLARLRESVRMRMLADVPLGAFLSGGVDSSTIVALMSEASAQPVRTFSIGFSEASYSELDAARRVAAHFGTQHTDLVVDPDVTDLCARVLSQFDEPFGDSSALPTYLVSRLAREQVTVALSGTGADELFAGYERYRMATLGARYASAPRFLTKPFEHVLSRLPSGHTKKSVVNRLKRFTHAARLDPLDRHTTVLGLFENRDTHYTESFRERLSEARPWVDAFTARDADHSCGPLNRLLRLDTRVTLPDDYLCKDDRASMAASLEVRVPFLDHRIAEFAAALPADLKLRGGRTKHILKNAVRGLVPDHIIDAPKQGFEVPIANWLCTDLKEFAHDHLLSEGNALHEIVSPETICPLLAAHESGRANHSRELWSLLALEVWYRNREVAVTAGSIAI